MVIETNTCNTTICDTCILDNDRFDFSETELKIWDILNISERRQMCNIPIIDRHEYLANKKEEYEVC